MNIEEINAFLSGTIGFGFVVLALFFHHFWRRSRVALHGFFALAFAMLALERVVLLFLAVQDEFRPFVFSIRLAAFLLIIVGIAHQNRRSS